MKISHYNLIFGLLLFFVAATQLQAQYEKSLDLPTKWNVRDENSPRIWGGSTAYKIRNWWEDTTSSDFYYSYISKRAYIGYRLRYFKLTDPTERNYNGDGSFREGYIGSVDELEELDGVFLPYMFYQIHPYFGIELGWEDIRARTTTYWDGHTDGDILASGPSLLGVGCYDNNTVFTPYAALGLVFFNARFHNDGVWHFGFNDENDHLYDEWASQGKDPAVNGGYRRNMECDDTIGVIIGAGCRINFTDNFSVDTALRHTSAELDSTYFLSWYGTSRRQNRGNFTYPINNISWHIGAAYNF